FQSTDSHQLAYKAIKLQTAFKEEIKMTIPAIALKEAINSFDIKKSIKLSKLDNTFILSSDTETFRTQTLEGDYPDVLVRLLSPL
ncbi:DNA polymerase III subunit beta, partial [Bacillus cereus group sp. Bce001]